MNQFKRTRSSLPVSSTPGDEWWRPLRSQERLNDLLIYLLAIGGAYVSIQVIYAACIRKNFANDEAIVVSALADLAIFAYSRKAVNEVEQGRSAWGIRLLVNGLSTATFSLNIYEVRHDALSVLLHSLAPLVWIAGHEIMLKGKLRRARAVIRQQRIEAGLSPAPVARLRLAQWIFAPRRTFQIWKRMIMWSLDPLTVTHLLVQDWKATKSDKPVPAAWSFVVADLTPAVTPLPQAMAQTQIPAQAQPAIAPAPQAPQPPAEPLMFKLQDAPDDVVKRFHSELPPVPPVGGSSLETWKFMTDVSELCNRLKIRYTDTLVADLIGCSRQAVSYTRKQHALTATP